jgi:4-carboxymuconolactone decarboxylase
VRHGRLSWPVPTELTTAARAVYDKIVGGPRASAASAFRLVDAAGRLEGPFNAMLLSPAWATHCKNSAPPCAIGPH